ncbi:MAG: flavodoxin family protein [Eubacteriales bacterium]|nr:flavodoxin family protein [Eubacteriales bacterium]
MKKILAINAGPRMGYNTDLLIKEAMKGAESKGAEVEYISLFQLEKYTGCISCFACKLPNTFGKCMCKDGLSEVLDKIRNADGIIIGSPNYLGDLTASFRALYERLVFQVLTYNKEEPCCNDHKIPVLLITTSNCGEEAYSTVGYDKMLDSYKNTLSTFVGPTEIFICGDTLQVKDYSRFNWTMFDPEAKKKHHDETFTEYLERAKEAGENLLD